MKTNSYKASKKNESKKTMVIVLICCIAILTIIATVVGCIMLINKEQPQIQDDYVELAKQYVVAEDYENAIDSYWTAISADPYNPDIYVELGNTYEEVSNPGMALNVYSLGYTRTHSAELQTLANKMSLYFSENTAELGSLVKKDDEITLNTTLISQFSEYKYEDYCEKYSTPQITVSGGTIYEVAFSDFDAKLYYYNVQNDNSIIIASSGKPANDRVANEVSLTSLDSLFVGMTRSISFEMLKNMNLAKLQKTTSDEYGKRVISFETNNCRIIIEYNKEGGISVDSWNRVYPLNVSREINGKFSLDGKIINAVTGEAVNNAYVKLYKADELSNLIGECITGNDGKYLFTEIASGDYVVIVSVQGFIEEKFDVVVKDVVKITSIDFTISPILEEGQIRIVLTWNASPRDLDSYLSGTDSQHNDVFVYFMNQYASNSEGEHSVELDVDDTDGYGPETTTIYDINGSYTYYVNDYDRTGRMREMGATVKIYTDSQQAPIVIDQMASDVVNTWEVCRIVNGQVEITNRSADQ